MHVFFLKPDCMKNNQVKKDHIIYSLIKSSHWHLTNGWAMGFSQATWSWFGWSAHISYIILSFLLLLKKKIQEILPIQDPHSHLASMSGAERQLAPLVVAWTRAVHSPLVTGLHPPCCPCLACWHRQPSWPLRAPPFCLESKFMA